MKNNTNLDISATLALALTHVFDAPRDVVWAAWTKREHLAQWWDPRCLRIPSVRLSFVPVAPSEST
jgi:uncharacterized protein YndB with AHSA1/START domain